MIVPFTRSTAADARPFLGAWQRRLLDASSGASQVAPARNAPVFPLWGRHASPIARRGFAASPLVLRRSLCVNRIVSFVAAMSLASGLAAAPALAQARASAAGIALTADALKGF